MHFHHPNQAATLAFRTFSTETQPVHAKFAQSGAVAPQKEPVIERFEYAVRLAAAAGGGFNVSCRDFAQLTAHGKDDVGAMAQAASAMETIFADYMRAALRLPAPSAVREGERLLSPPAETVAKAALNSAMNATGCSNTDLARCLGVDEKEVRRMRDPHYGSKLPRIAEAISVLGLRLVIGLEAA